MEKTLSIEGMSCKHCVEHVRNALVGLPGVSGADVDLKKKRAIVSGTALDEAAMRAAVSEAGYSVTAVD
jgi:copper chaperone